MKSILVLLFLSTSIAIRIRAASSSAQEADGSPPETDVLPCTAHFEAVDAVCKDESGWDMEQCFSSCMDERNMAETPPCAELEGALCSCGNHCAHTEECERAMVVALNCNLEHELGCEGHTCAASAPSAEGEEL